MSTILLKTKKLQSGSLVVPLPRHPNYDLNGTTPYIAWYLDSEPIREAVIHDESLGETYIDVTNLKVGDLIHCYGVLPLTWDTPDTTPVFKGRITDITSGRLEIRALKDEQFWRSINHIDDIGPTILNITMCKGETDALNIPIIEVATVSITHFVVSGESEKVSVWLLEASRGKDQKNYIEKLNGWLDIYRRWYMRERSLDSITLDGFLEYLLKHGIRAERIETVGTLGLK